MGEPRYCDSKKICFSKEKAEREVVQWKPERGFIRAYRCPDCGWWHLTSKRQWVTV